MTRTISHVALVGCGRRFISSIEPVLASRNVSVVLVVEPDRGARNYAARGLGHGTAMTMETLTAQALREANPEGVIIASPSGLHFEHASISLSCGLPTFVEKPVSCTSDTFKSLYETGRGLLSIAEQRIHRSDLNEVRSIIKSGLLGDVRRIIYHDSIAPAEAFKTSWRNEPRLACGGVLLDLGYHTIGTIQWLLGRDESHFIVRSSRLPRHDLQVESRAEVNCTWGGIEIELDIALSRSKPREVLTIQGSCGRVSIKRWRTGSNISTLVLETSDYNLEREIPLGGVYDTRSLSDFIDGVQRDERLTCQVTILELIGKIYQSADWRIGELLPCT